ncbi:MAG: GntR family transcriptional regulator [Pseudomonadota bacterium]
MQKPQDPGTLVDPYEILRDGLIWGRWKSGERLKPQHLKDELGCSRAALREALLRLAGEGFVEAEKHHGFRATDHTEETFRQAAHLRQLLECEGARMAIARGDFEWEMTLNAAHHNLAYIEEQMSGAEDIEPFLKRWSRQDWLFHSALLSACGSPLLMQSYKSVFDTFRMYAVSQMVNFGFSDATRAEHQAIYDAAIARDPGRCGAAIRSHLEPHENDNRATRAQKGENT